MLEWIGKPNLLAGGAATSLQRCGDTSLPDHQSAVRIALEADDRVYGKPAEIGRAELGGAGLQHLVSATENVAGRHFIPGVNRAAALRLP